MAEIPRPPHTYPSDSSDFEASFKSTWAQAIGYYYAHNIAFGDPGGIVEVQGIHHGDTAAYQQRVYAVVKKYDVSDDPEAYVGRLISDERAGNQINQQAYNQSVRRLGQMVAGKEILVQTRALQVETIEHSGDTVSRLMPAAVIQVSPLTEAGKIQTGYQYDYMMVSSLKGAIQTPLHPEVNAFTMLTSRGQTLPRTSWLARTFLSPVSLDNTSARVTNVLPEFVDPSSLLIVSITEASQE